MLATSILWGLSFISTRVLSDHGMHPVEIYIYRFLAAYLLLLAVCHKRILAYSWRDEGLFLLLGLTGGSIYFIAENIAVTLTDVANVSLITTLSPLITVFLVAALYRNERPGQWIVMGSLIAVVGVVMVVFGGAQGASFHPAGDLLALGAAVSFSIYGLIIKKINVTYSSWFITRKSFFYGLVTALPLMFMEPTHLPFSQFADIEVWGNLLFLSLVCSLLAFLAMARAIQVIGPVKANNYLYIQPIVTMIAGWLILGEKVMWTGWTGCALIIGGLWLGETLTRRRALSTDTHRKDRENRL
ncbi:MAG: DMT family transporter [Clostridiales bacterium]|nr:DMT family transporter [Clostridiales bacterium]